MKKKKAAARMEFPQRLRRAEEASLRRLMSARVVNDCVEQFHVFSVSCDQRSILIDAFQRYQAAILSALQLRRDDTGDSLEADILLINSEWVLEQSCATHHEYYRFVPTLRITRSPDGAIERPKVHEGVATYAVFTSYSMERGVVLAKDVHKSEDTVFYREVPDKEGGGIRYKAEKVGALYKPADARPPYRCILSVPVTRVLEASRDPLTQPKQECLGVLNITHAKATAFTQQDFAWAMACAALIGSLHASLYARLSVEEHPNEVLLDVRRVERKQSQASTSGSIAIQSASTSTPGVPMTSPHPSDDCFQGDQLNADQIQPWSLLRERDYLHETTKLDDVAEKAILERLQRYGFVLLRMGAFTPEDALLSSLEHLLGPACDTQNDYNGRIKLIEPDPAKEAISGESGKELAPHVDGTQDEHVPPAMLAFQYLSGATHGGYSTFMDMADVLREIVPSDRSQVLTDLARHDAADCTKEKKREDGSLWRGSYQGALVKPVLNDTGLSLRVRFDRVLKVAEAYRPSFTKLERAVLARGQDKRVTFLPREGDIAIFDNWRVMHGRLAVSGRHIRHHNRIWFRDLAARHKGTYRLGVRGLSVERMHEVKRAGVPA